MFGRLRSMKPFIGRQKELKKLELLTRKRVASFVVIRGRRRIGKSRLIEEFGKSRPSYIFAGLPPTEKTTRRSQLDEFAKQMARAFDLPPFKVDDWGELFHYLSKRCMQGPVLIALDEISWIGSKDPNFLGQLKNAWDLHFSKNPKLILIVCGSVSSWIEKNLLSSTGFLGRISLDIRLKELPLEDAAQFWDSRRDRTSPYEIFKILSVTGGVPRYLEELQPHLSAEENIQHLCFEESGLLYREFGHIFSDLFSSRASIYSAIVESLASGVKSLEEIADGVGKARSTLSAYLQDLIQAGFITADPTWNLATMKVARLRFYRLSDNYLRFYLRYIAPNRDIIQAGTFRPESLIILPQWESVMGLQFENLVLNNLPVICDAMQVPLSSVVKFGPYFQRQTKRHQGCQIDLMIQSRYKILFLCEVKFSVDKIGMAVAREMDAKLKRLPLPRGWSSRLVLVHVNGVTGELRGSNTFDHIVDFSALL